MLLMQWKFPFSYYKPTTPLSTQTLNRNTRPTSISISPSAQSINEESPNFDQQLTLRDICNGHVPDHIMRRVEEVGYIKPTEIQRQALPVLFLILFFMPRQVQGKPWRTYY